MMVRPCGLASARTGHPAKEPPMTFLMVFFRKLAGKILLLAMLPVIL